MKINLRQKTILSLTLILLPFISAYAQLNPQTIKLTVNNEVREALIYIPATAKTQNTPIIFAFHGHGGTMRNTYMARRFDKLWQDAIFICPQGLNTVGLLTDPEGKKSGWAMNIPADRNRDLKFFDAMLDSLRSAYKVDNSRIYATGHSNGGGFTYLLLANRANEFAAIAPTATSAGRITAQLKTPKPVFHLMGTNDPLVKPNIQKMTYNWVKRLNQCDEKGIGIDSNMTVFSGKNGNDVQLFTHSGGHEYPKSANKAIIDFFKKHSK